MQTLRTYDCAVCGKRNNFQAELNAPTPPCRRCGADQEAIAAQSPNSPEAIEEALREVPESTKRLVEGEWNDRKPLFIDELHPSDPTSDSEDDRPSEFDDDSTDR